jgi:2-phospho-L-lactate guanylyltransferase
MPADIPAVRSSDIELLLQETSGHDTSAPFVLLAPSRDRMGTNALLLTPPDVIELRFGYDSFSYYVSEAVSKGLPLRIFQHERIGLDIDQPEDLKRFLSSGSGGETYRALLQMGAATLPEHRNVTV